MFAIVFLKYLKGFFSSMAEINMTVKIYIRTLEMERFMNYKMVGVGRDAHKK
jgi:hypothetical protein